MDEDAIYGLGFLLPGLWVGRNDLVADLDVLDRFTRAVPHQHHRCSGEGARFGALDAPDRAFTPPAAPLMSLPPGGWLRLRGVLLRRRHRRSLFRCYRCCRPGWLWCRRGLLRRRWICRLRWQLLGLQRRLPVRRRRRFRRRRRQCHWLPGLRRELRPRRTDL
jgi:hypothetical protein